MQNRYLFLSRWAGALNKFASFPETAIEEEENCTTSNIKAGYILFLRIYLMLTSTLNCKDTYVFQLDIYNIVIRYRYCSSTKYRSTVSIHIPDKSCYKSLNNNKLSNIPLRETRQIITINT